MQTGDTEEESREITNDTATESEININYHTNREDSQLSSDNSNISQEEEEEGEEEEEDSVFEP